MSTIGLAACAGSHFHENSALFRQLLGEGLASCRAVRDVRVFGLLLAIELVEDRKTKVPATAATAQLLEAARENRIMVGRGGLHGNVLRLSPPMNIGRADVDEFIHRLDVSLEQVERALSPALATV